MEIQKDFRKILEISLVLLLVTITLCYGIYKAYPLLAGPSLTILSPKDGDYVASTTFLVSGHAKRVKEISIQGRSIAIDEQGNFKEILVSSYPHTVIVMNASDFYGKTVTKTIQVIPR